MRSHLLVTMFISFWEYSFFSLSAFKSFHLCSQEPVCLCWGIWRFMHLSVDFFEFPLLCECGPWACRFMFLIRLVWFYLLSFLFSRNYHHTKLLAQISNHSLISLMSILFFSLKKIILTYYYQERFLQSVWNQSFFMKLVSLWERIPKNFSAH